MIKKDIKQIYTIKDKKSILEDIYKTLSISIALANGMVWKEKTQSFYKTIAREIKDVFDNKLLNNIELKKFKNKYLRINIDNNSIIFLKNNIFSDDSIKLDYDTWIKQKLIIIENKQLPDYLTSKEKEDMFKTLSDNERDILNTSYSRQELNSDRFSLNKGDNNKDKVLKILNKFNYYDITVEEYLNLMSEGKYENKNITNDKNISIFKNTFNNYILEIGVYITKEIENYLK